MEHEADTSIGTACVCGGIRTTQCHDCFLYEATCEACFVKGHTNVPFHWALVWNETFGYFERKDISVLGHILPFGHGGKVCPSPKSEVNFIVAHTNGIHATRASFCACHGDPDRVEQLMRAQMFPATPSLPQTAFTFAFLKEYHLDHLECKKSAFDHHGAKVRLTDNAFPMNVPVSL